MREKLTVENPALVQEWDYEKNGDLHPEDFTSGSNKTVWWRCKLGHSWLSSVNSRIRGRGCPYCTGKKVWRGYNDIVTTYPDVAAQWDYVKNDDLKPEQFSIGSNKKFWWKCEYGHSWEAVLYSRKSCGCPVCAGKIITAGVNDLQTINPDLAKEWDTLKNGKSPDSVAANDNNKAWWLCAKGHSWEAVIGSRNRGNGCPYCSHRQVLAGFNDLMTAAPELAPEWDYEKNGDLLPTQFSPGSDKKVWWLCEQGHSWKAVINSRKTCGCPVCAGNTLIKSVNDLQTVNPNLAKEWDSIKNGSLRPDSVSANTNGKAWWLCDKGHSWEAVIGSRNAGRGCPFCNSSSVLTGFNDLTTVASELAAEWDYERNGELLPDNVMGASNIYVWWKCKRGHKWKAQIANRRFGRGCPYCAGKLVIFGETDLQTLRPDLCKEWDYEKNILLKPNEVSANSGKKAYWICSKGHSYTAKVIKRNNGSGCPVCVGNIVIPGKNDLKTLRPDIAAEWDYEKNGSLTPEQITGNTIKKVWWRCKRGHSYESFAYNRFRNNGCPYCAGELQIIGETDFATIHPELVSEWDYDKNYPDKPENYTAFKNKKVWWKCQKGHSWKAEIYDRHNGCGCPYCVGKVPMRTRLVK